MNSIGNGSADHEEVLVDDTEKPEMGSKGEETPPGADAETIAQKMPAVESETSDAPGDQGHNDGLSHEKHDHSDDVLSQSTQQGKRKYENDRSPPKKRFRHSPESSEMVRVSSTLPPPPLPLVGGTSSAVLTESSLESPADLQESNDALKSQEIEENLETPLAKNPPDEIDRTAETPHHYSPSSSSQAAVSCASPSSHLSETSPLPPPPAPPSTPASASSAFQEAATPRPSFDEEYGGVRQHGGEMVAGVMENAHFLEQKAAQAATPAPTKRRKAAAHGPSLVEDFSDWAVGDRYELMRILGRGSYGEVAQARDLKVKGGDAFVAIKRITSAFDQEVDAIRLFREMHILRRLRGHECIIQLLDVVQPPSDDLDDFHDLYLVFEYVDTDLYKLIMSPQYLTTEHIQTFLYQMLAALKFIHSSSVIHRDLKPANILLNEDCSLKICDFGLARIVNHSTTVSSATGDEEAKIGVVKASAAIDTPTSFGSPPKGRLTRQLTKHVVTRWYRAPELILIQPYTSAVDIWSLGCILAELLSMQEGSVPGYQDRVPLFPGGSCYPLSGEGGSVKKDERLDQLSVIFGVIGTPDQEDIDSIGKANEYIKTLEKQKGKPFESLFPAADPSALDLLKKMLQFNPRHRCTAEEALEHEFLRGVRRKEMEKGATEPLVGPDFLETAKVDIETLKRRTYEEVLWYRDQVVPKNHGGLKLAEAE